MRFAHVRVAAVTVLSGSFLTLGMVGTAQAAAQASTATDTVCQALPAVRLLRRPRRHRRHLPSPSPSPSTSPSPTPSSPVHPRAAPPRPVTRQRVAVRGQRHASPSDDLAVAPSPERRPPRHPAGVTTATGVGTATVHVATAPPRRTAASALDACRRAPRSDPSPATSGSPSEYELGAPPELCVSVQRSQSSIKRGQTATYVVQVSTQERIGVGRVGRAGRAAVQPEARVQQRLRQGRRHRLVQHRSVTDKPASLDARSRSRRTRPRSVR